MSMSTFQLVLPNDRPRHPKPTRAFTDIKQRSGALYQIWPPRPG